jgi:DNA-binding XRE family transcriptional regulator
MSDDRSKIPEEYMSAKMWVLAPHRINSLEWDERLGNQLKTIRESQGLTQPKLAEKAGISRNLIEHLERGKYLESSSWSFHICVNGNTRQNSCCTRSQSSHALYVPYPRILKGSQNVFFEFS